MTTMNTYDHLLEETI